MYQVFQILFITLIYARGNDEFPLIELKKI
jgi:hypothetical protein